MRSPVLLFRGRPAYPFAVPHATSVCGMVLLLCEFAPTLWDAVGLVTVVFVAVAVHETAHRFAADLFGFTVLPGTVYPFAASLAVTGSRAAAAVRASGVAAVALAGPAGNLATAAVVVWLVPGIGAPPDDPAAATPFVTRAVAANLWFAAVNLVPAHGLDAGVMARALFRDPRPFLLSGRVLLCAAVVAAFAVGQVTIAVLILSTLVVSAGAEWRERVSSAAGAVTSEEVMTPLGELRVLRHGSRIGGVLRELGGSRQPYFPVVYGRDVIGLVSRKVLLRAGTRGDGYVTTLVDRGFVTVRGDAPLSVVMDHIEARGGAPVVVADDRGFRGMVFGTDCAVSVTPGRAAGACNEAAE